MLQISATRQVLPLASQPARRNLHWGSSNQVTR